MLCRDSLRPIKPYRASNIRLASAAAALRGDVMICFWVPKPVTFFPPLPLPADAAATDNDGALPTLPPLVCFCWCLCSVAADVADVVHRMGWGRGSWSNSIPFQSPTPPVRSPAALPSPDRVRRWTGAAFLPLPPPDQLRFRRWPLLLAPCMAAAAMSP